VFVRLGLFGGTFNPIHFGHLRAAEEVADSLHLHRLLFIPAARPPHKNAGSITAFDVRMAMISLAVSGHPLFEVSDIENQRAEKSYSVETIRLFRRQVGPDTEIYFIVGLDAMLEIETWREYREIFTLCHLVVLDRPGYDPADLAEFLHQKVKCRYQDEEKVYVHPGGKRIYFRPITRLDVSSSLIRRLAGRGLSLRFLLPEGVRRYILENKLYS
jgi:nicotinate-nucleotide adenylyltransferase